ncbi:MAG: hypothetical protein LJE85_11130 [Gammaproteobacteria bacterium]|nr:hypothetical protein [Gammaproteobacteria bacterium]
MGIRSLEKQRRGWVWVPGHWKGHRR